MPSLENLKKQAKLYVRWHRDRHYPVAEQIRAGLPRFGGLSDQEVLAADFKLSDAQELVAKQHGYESWQALRTGVAAMTDRTAAQSSAVAITAAEPEIFVSDIESSCRFFTGKLRFAIVFKYGSPPFYAQVVRDGARLNLRHVDRPVIDPAIRDREELLSAAMTVETPAEIKQLFLEFQAAGVVFHQTLQRQPWGASNFIIKDPDGNLILFAGPAGGA
jgi:catechol 2,3-dioxygenase-like lactoylglutathione lyase family enzyme